VNPATNLLSDLRLTFHDQLDPLYGKEETDAFFVLLLEFYANMKKSEWMGDPSIRISESVINKISTAVGELRRYKPVQYIPGQARFLDLDLKVAPGILIPRPETEELAQWIIDDNAERTGLSILDVGTGSGCLAISLAKYMDAAYVQALDYQKEIISIADENATNNGVNVDFLILDLKDKSQWSLLNQYDIIVSNPPYVRELEKGSMCRNVLDHEPGEALFVSDNDPLMYYRLILELACKCLKQNGKIYFEINENSVMELKQLLSENNLGHYLFKKDIRGKNRFLRIED